MAVAGMSLAVVALGLSADDVRSVERAAELHDLGKVAIPSAILLSGPILGIEVLRDLASNTANQHLV
jgi:response regulator RpfG family c-di-GMP phosphodiesterase